jgi:hypothetical protein
MSTAHPKPIKEIKTMSTQANRKDVYTRVTERIISDLEQGIRTWMKPWSVEHTAGRITKPLRHNGTPYRGMNTLLLWGEALAKGYAAPIWMTYKQAQETGGQVCKGEHGSLVVYANSITKTETNEKGEDAEREIPFMKGYTVFKVEQVDGLPAHYCAQPANPLPLSDTSASTPGKNSVSGFSPESRRSMLHRSSIDERDSSRCPLLHWTLFAETTCWYSTRSFPPFVTRVSRPRADEGRQRGIGASPRPSVVADN